MVRGLKEGTVTASGASLPSRARFASHMSQVYSFALSKVLHIQISATPSSVSTAGQWISIGLWSSARCALFTFRISRQKLEPEALCADIKDILLLTRYLSLIWCLCIIHPPVVLLFKMVVQIRRHSNGAVFDRFRPCFAHPYPCVSEACNTETLLVEGSRSHGCFLDHGANPNA